MKTYDLLIIGCSAAATSAGIYAARRGLDFKIITKEFGGEVIRAGEIGNWPGMNNVSGVELAKQFRDHLEYYKADMEDGVEVKKIEKRPDGSFLIGAKSADKPVSYLARTVIVTTGVQPRKLGVPGEDEFLGMGVSYCTICDGPLFAGKTVAIIGTGNAGIEAALMLSDICPKVWMLDIASGFQGEQILMNSLRRKSNVKPIFEVKISKITGKDFVSGLKYTKDGTEEELSVEGVFIHIGMTPNSKIVPGEVLKNDLGEMIINKNCETNIPGLFAAGDVTDIPFKQIVVAAGQGAVAALSAVNYLNKTRK